MSGAESKTATLRMATEKLHELKGGNIEGLIAQKKLENKIKAIDEEIAEKIKSIKDEPMDEELVKVKAKADYASKLKENARYKLVKIQQAEQVIAQAELDVSRAKKTAEGSLKQAELDLLEAKKEAETLVSQAELTVKTRKERLEQLKEIAKEEEERANLTAKHDLDKDLKSVENTEKAKQREINKAEAEGKKRKKETEEELELLKIRNNSKDSGVVLYERLFDTVEKISVLPAVKK